MTIVSVQAVDLIYVLVYAISKTVCFKLVMFARQYYYWIRLFFPNTNFTLFLFLRNISNIEKEILTISVIRDFNYIYANIWFEYDSIGVTNIISIYVFIFSNMFSVCMRLSMRIISKQIVIYKNRVCSATKNKKKVNKIVQI